jgi:GMP reductase
MTEALILHGADIVKVGIGPGAACSTRMVTGVGYPQLSAIMETADAAHGLDGHIMADGGCQMPGDVAKAFAAGADFVMLGSMLAGHDETGSEFYGMSSNKAQLKYGGELKDYRASEGLELTIENRGPLKNTIKQILGGLRSACTYIGAQELKHMPICSTFVRTERQ